MKKDVVSKKEFFNFISEAHAGFKFSNVESEMPQVCISENQRLDPSCKCKESNSCYQLKIEQVLPMVKSSKIANRFIETFNQIARGEKNFDQLDIDQIEMYHTFLNKLNKQILNKVNDDRKKQGKEEFPSISNLIEPGVSKFVYLSKSLSIPEKFVKDRKTVPIAKDFVRLWAFRQVISKIVLKFFQGS